MTADPPHAPVVDAAVLSDVGRVRETNEDSIRYCVPPATSSLPDYSVLCVVADGLGGHQGGEIASAMAVEIIEQVYFATSGDTIRVLSDALSAAHIAVLTKSRSDPACAGMGCTCTALVIRQGQAYCAHVGDSRLYWLRGETLKQVTEDDTFVNELVRAGILTEDEARSHPNRHRLARALGVAGDFECSAWSSSEPVLEGDVFLLCTDGLYDLVGPSEISRILHLSPSAAAAQKLIDLANQRGGHDNVSVGILRICDAGPGR